MNEIGRIIKEARKEKGLTQKELGEKLGVSYQMIAQYESGRRKPKIETLKRISAVLGVGLEDFMTDSEISLFESLSNLYLNAGNLIVEESLKYTPEETALIMKFRQLNTKGRNKVTGYASDLSKRAEYTEKKLMLKAVYKKPDAENQ